MTRRKMARTEKMACAWMLALAALASGEAAACSAVIVGKKASSTGYVIVAHNNDGPSTIRMRRAVVPARDGKLGFFWGECKEPKGGITPGDTMLNERGVIVISNNGGFMNEWCGRQGTLPDEGCYSGLAGDGIGFELRRTIAERARSAREGVILATNLLATSGYVQSSRVFAIADKDEAWILEVIKGRRFVARRCPDDAAVAYPNCLTIGRLEPGDIVSANIEAQRDRFDFAATYQGPRTWRSPYNRLRMKHLYRIVCGREPDLSGPYPFSMKPTRPVTPTIVRQALSSHYEGTEDALGPHPAKADETAERSPATICRSSTLESLVCAFAAKTNDIALALTTGRPCEKPYACYRPLGGVLPVNASTGDMAAKRLDERGAPLPPPVRTGVFSGNGPRANGFIAYLRLIANSPDLELTPVDAHDVRSGALDRLDLLVMPGGDSRSEKRDLGADGAARIREFLRRGGGYIGSCAGCCLLMDENMSPERGINVIPFYRTGSKGGYMMPVKVNAKGAKALGIAEKTYAIRYHGGPVLEPSTNVIAGASFEIWGTYEHDFGKPGSKPEMVGRGAMVGGTYGKGRVFAFAVHPENYSGTRELLRGAFRYVVGHDVAFVERPRQVGSYVVGWFDNAVSGKDVAQAMLAVDTMTNVDLFPLSSDDIQHGMLDHVDLLVLPDGSKDFYRKKLTTAERTLIAAFQSRGGRIIGWGQGAKACPDAQEVASSAEALDVVAAAAARRTR